MASLPLFFHDAPMPLRGKVSLDEDTARHVVQVLRMQQGESLRLTDGKGTVATVSISATAKKKCEVTVNNIVFHEKPAVGLHLAVGFTKNTSRNEWLLEKATELGVRTIIPLSTARTEKERIRHDRWKGILVSAMLQSQQYYLPELTEPQPIKSLIDRYKDMPHKLIGHCIEDKERIPLPKILQAGSDAIILIGPEGDFTAEEVTLCEQAGFSGISLVSQRLRTETAAMMVCAYFNTINNETA